MNIPSRLLALALLALAAACTTPPAQPADIVGNGVSPPPRPLCSEPIITGNGRVICGEPK